GAYQSRGRAYLDRQEYERALPDLDEAVRLAPRMAEARLRRGEVLAELGRFELAAADFTEGIHLTPGAADAYRGRAKAWMALGRFEEAEADFAAAREQGAEEELMHEPKALIYTLLQGHFQPAPLDTLVMTERSFPGRVRPDLQRAIDGLLTALKL